MHINICILYKNVSWVHSTHIFYRSVYRLMVQLCTIQAEVVSPLAPKKYTVLNWNFVFDLRDVFQERIPGVKRDLPVYTCIVGQTFLISFLQVFYITKFHPLQSCNNFRCYSRAVELNATHPSKKQSIMKSTLLEVTNGQTVRK